MVENSGRKVVSECQILIYYLYYFRKRNKMLINILKNINNLIAKKKFNSYNKIKLSAYSAYYILIYNKIIKK
ncbi:unnamed protein product [Blepharisma stoltei]|uniref:Uncharacterized protein n=1 Tax=Blepharisma stoltei TaxID=1481888 RepID=A0AAU9JIV0_9CILI|nr:unnamed protein product [Blepharisma stoltei]